MPSPTRKINSVLSDFKLDLENAEEINQHIVDFFSKDVQKYALFLDEVAQLIPENQFGKDAIYKKLKKMSDNVIAKGSEVQDRIQSKALVKKIKEKFRSLVGKFVYQSLIMERAFKKPRGYPGDYQTLEYIYDNKIISSGIGYFFDKYFLENEIADAVRNRKELMVSILTAIIDDIKAAELNILNIASGSSRDIKDFLTLFNKSKDLKFNCLDHDGEAIEFSKNRLRKSGRTKFNFIKEDAIKFARNLSKTPFEKQDIIYSIGLADYIPAKLLKKIISSYFELLKVDGKLIVAHKDKTKFNPLPPDWFCDWVFIPRDEKELVNIVNESSIKNFSLEIKREKSGVIFFLILEKHG